MPSHPSLQLITLVKNGSGLIGFLASFRSCGQWSLKTPKSDFNILDYNLWMGIASFKVVHCLASSFLPQKSVFLFLFTVLALVLSNSIGCAVQAYYGQFLYMQVSWGFTVANPDYLAPQIYKWTSAPQRPFPPPNFDHLQYAKMWR